MDVAWGTGCSCPRVEGPTTSGGDIVALSLVFGQARKTVHDECLRGPADADFPTISAGRLDSLLNKKKKWFSPHVPLMVKVEKYVLFSYFF